MGASFAHRVAACAAYRGMQRDCHDVAGPRPFGPCIVHVDRAIAVALACPCLFMRGLARRMGRVGFAGQCVPQQLVPGKWRFVAHCAHVGNADHAFQCHLAAEACLARCRDPVVAVVAFLRNGAACVVVEGPAHGHAARGSAVPASLDHHGTTLLGHGAAGTVPHGERGRVLVHPACSFGTIGALPTPCIAL